MHFRPPIMQLHYREFSKIFSGKHVTGLADISIPLEQNQFRFCFHCKRHLHPTSSGFTDADAQTLCEAYFVKQLVLAGFQVAW